MHAGMNMIAFIPVFNKASEMRHSSLGAARFAKTATPMSQKWKVVQAVRAGIPNASSFIDRQNSHTNYSFVSTLDES
jgi:hypothetical protein